MKLPNRLAVFLAGVMLVTTWATAGHSVTTQPWQNPSNLNVEGVRLGMPARDVWHVHPTMDATIFGVACDPGRHVKFVYGMRVLDGDTLVASADMSYATAVKALGKPYATAHDRTLPNPDLAFYRAGSHWLILSYDIPRFDSRAGSIPQFALAMDADSIPADGWGRQYLFKALR